MSKAQVVKNTNINSMLSNKVVELVTSAVEETLPDRIETPAPEPSALSTESERPTITPTRRHSITLDLDDLYLMRKDLGAKAYILLLLLTEFGVDEMLSGHRQEVDIFAFAKRHNLEAEDVHKGLAAIKNISIAGSQLKIPFIYNPPTEDR